jgi:hypothetical protein
MLQANWLSRTAVFPLVQFVAAGLIGVVLLPAVLAGGAPPNAGPLGQVPTAAAAWLALAIIVAIWLAVVSVSLARALGRRLGAFQALVLRATHEDLSRKVASPFWLSALIVAVIDVALLEAILRRPLVAVFGAFGSPVVADAVVAAAALVVLLAGLVWLFQTARPLLEAATWFTLDGVLATSGSEAAARRYAGDQLTQAGVTATAARPPDRRVSAADLAATVAAGDAEATRLAGEIESQAGTGGLSQPVVPSGDATILAGADGEATVVDAKPDATRPGS